jgi:hypothetical protein
MNPIVKSRLYVQDVQSVFHKILMMIHVNIVRVSRVVNILNVIIKDVCYVVINSLLVVIFV